MKKYIYTALATALVLSSCASDEIVETAPERTPITINAYTEGITRFTVANAESLKTGFTLYITDGTNEIYKGRVVDNGSGFTFDNSGVPVYWPITESADVTFMAISGTTTTNTVAIDGTTDVLVAKKVAKKSQSANGSIDLVFSHLLAATQLQVQAVDDSGKGLSASLTALSITSTTSNATYDYMAGTWGTAAPLATYPLVTTPTTITTATATPLTTDAMLLVPGTYTISATYIVTSDGAVGDEFTRKANIEFTAGQQTNYTIMLPVTPTEMKVTVSSVTGWPDATTGDPVTVTD